MKRLSTLAASLGLLAALGLFAAMLTSAHEQRAIDNGKYHVVIGWLNEPAFSGMLNSVDLTVTQAPAAPATPAAAATATSDDEHPVGTPVDGLADTLKVDVVYNDQKMTLDLQPAWKQPGKYTGYVIPMVAGDFSFHVYGTINGDKIDETFTSGPNTFGSVVDSKTIQFPKP